MDKVTPRPLIVTVATPELAKTLHNYGSGYRVTVRDGSGTDCYVWCNPDLIKSDRIPNYNARKLQRERRNKREETTNQCTKDNTDTNGNISDCSVNSSGSF